MSQDYSAYEDALSSAEIIGTETLPHSWREAPRAWGNELHKLAPYVGGFPPALANYLLQQYTDPEMTVLDPFSGGGTTALEAALLDRDVLASDVFSYACTLTGAKTHPLTEDEFDAALKRVKRDADDINPKTLPPVDEDAAIFFHDDTLQELRQYRAVLKEDSSRDGRFLKALICGILHGPSELFLSIQTRDTFSGSASYVKDYKEEHGLEEIYKSVDEKASDKFNRLVGAQYPSGNTRVEQADATSLPFEDDTADFVLTSPPYMHMLDYSWNNWLRLWWLDEDRSAEQDSLNQTSKVELFRSFMTDVIAELDRVLKSDSRAIIVIGDVRKHRQGGAKVVYPARMIAAEASEFGFEVERVIEDDYNVDKRYYTQLNNLRWDEEEEDNEQELIDRILVLRKGDPGPQMEVTPEWSD
ncbi:class I SAM-dependent methyltransferase [Natronorubrum daqingense]|uniref:site-specific DNA-methyltransferase (cytosine-N(4)-specific) n=1 Tax=Natronorubrum daqingense TaxID=588898 RepID=A0A1N7AFD8_9EURY|nr:class I SAM-dependent methyltransferase [Natronorubrum daqingense]APX98001.1 DNA methylase [Natronorubrum daqingense]SIR37857.1 DNA methylase [Natronorubrum daqingense]